jgi:glycosyltransferase involved in cell wall biosynthesis
MPRVAIVVSHPIQHFGPFYRALAADGRVELTVLFASAAYLRPMFDPQFNRAVSWQSDILDGYSYEMLPGAEAIERVDRPVKNRALWRRLDALEPDVVQVYGFWHGISRDGILWARLRQRRVLMMADSELRTPRGTLERARKRATVPLMLRLVDGLLTVGDCNEAYYRHYGVPAKKMFRSPLPIDETRLRAALAERAERRAKVRAKLGVSDGETLALFVGKLIDSKCPMDLVEAVRDVPSVRVVFCGDGELRKSLEAAGSERCMFPGFVDVAELPSYYVAADVLVHPSSSDPHPLAVAEAAFCGLPLVLSDRIGSIGPTDDGRDGENALVYPFGDRATLAAHLRRLASDAALRALMGARSREIGERRTLAASVEGYVRAVDEVLTLRA